MWRAIASNALTFLILLFLCVGAVVTWGKGKYTAAGPLSEPICLRIERGSNFRALSVQLAEQNIISYPSLFRMGAEYTDRSQDLKFGHFLLPSGISMEEITAMVTSGGADTCGSEIVYRIGITRDRVQVREVDPANGRYVEQFSFELDTEPPQDFQELKLRDGVRHRIAFAEGITSFRVVEAIRNIDILTGDINEIPSEGSLAPDSFDIAPGGDRSGLLMRMQFEQAERIAKAWEQRDKDVPLATQDELLIMASIIEKETGVAGERGLVSSVFANRLLKGMPLQTDPTVIYGIMQGKAPLGRGLRQSELRKDTPWNTYTNKGLPKTAIANPSMASLLAAGQPETSDYIFFVADGEGGHAFATNLNEHNKNVAKWREIEAQRKASGD